MIATMPQQRNAPESFELVEEVLILQLETIV